MFLPDELYPSLGMDIAYHCEDGLVFAHNIHNDPVIYTTCQPNGKMKHHGKIGHWPICISRKK